MKLTTKVLVLLLMLHANTLIANSRFSIGLKGGLNYATFWGEDVEIKIHDGASLTPQYLMGFSGGIVMKYQLNDLIAVQPEIILSLKGAIYENFLTMDEISLSEETTMLYIDFPLLATFEVYKGLNLIAGPYYSIPLGDALIRFIDSDGTEYGSSYESSLSTKDYGLIVGIGYSIGRHISIESRYSFGMEPWEEDSEYDVKHSGLQLLLGLSIP